jgi:hypothetical protein
LDHAWTEVERVCRRISFLRAVGREGDADRVQRTDLAAALTMLQQAAGDPSEVAARAGAVQATEQTRADRAVAFAHLLSPRLQEHIQPEEISRQLRAIRKIRPLITRG